MEDSCLENVLSLVPSHLKKLTTTIELLSDEMKEDYLMSVKKAIGEIIFLVFLMDIIFFYRANCEGYGYMACNVMMLRINWVAFQLVDS